MTKLVTISVPAHTVQALDEAAKKEGRSRSNYVTHIIKQAIRQTRKANMQKTKMED
jgi:metal-responsive CopG/Arc/MetJ family transcriptional regulator